MSGGTREAAELVCSLSDILPESWACGDTSTVGDQGLSSRAWVITELVTGVVSPVSEALWAGSDIDASSVADEGLSDGTRVVAELVGSLSDVPKVGLACSRATTVCVNELTTRTWVVTEVVAIYISSVSKARWAGIDIDASSVVDEGLISSARVVTE